MNYYTRGIYLKNLDAPELAKALEVMERINFTNDERVAYEDHLKWLRDENSAIKKAEMKGKEEGIEQRTMDIALAMLGAKEPMEKIKLYAHLSTKEIMKLQESALAGDFPLLTA